MQESSAQGCTSRGEGRDEGPGAGTWDTSPLKLCSQSQQARGLVPGLTPGRTRGVRQAVHARSVNAGGASAGLPSGARGAQGSHASGIRRASAGLGTRLGSRLPGRYEFGNGKGTNIADGHYISEGCFVYTHRTKGHMDEDHGVTTHIDSYMAFVDNTSRSWRVATSGRGDQLLWAAGDRV